MNPRAFALRKHNHDASDAIGTTSIWTPTLLGSSVLGTQTYTIQIGYYKKINDLIHVQGFVAISAKDAAMAGHVHVGGLPYPLKNVANFYGSLAIGDAGGITLTAGYTQLALRPDPGAFGAATIMQIGSGVNSIVLPVASLAASSLVIFSGTYLTD